MNPQEQCCHNADCWASGRRGLGTITIHSHAERRDKCERCGKTFSATQGTALYRAHQAPACAALAPASILAIAASSAKVAIIVRMTGLHPDTQKNTAVHESLLLHNNGPGYHSWSRQVRMGGK